MTTLKKTDFYQKLIKHKEYHQQVANKEISPEEFLSITEQTLAQDPSCPSCYLSEEKTIQFEIFRKALSTLSYIKGTNRNTQQQFENLLSTISTTNQVQISIELAQTLRYHRDFWTSNTYNFETVVRDIRIFQEKTSNFTKHYKEKAISTPIDNISNPRPSTSIINKFFGTTPSHTPKRFKEILPDTDQEDFSEQEELEQEYLEPEPIPETTPMEEHIKALTDLIHQINVPNNGKKREYTLVKVDFFTGNGDDPVEWLELFEKAAQANNWDEERQLQLAPTYLRKTADGWYKALDNLPEDFDTFKKIFLEQFRTPARVMTWRNQLEMCCQKDNETIDQYVARFRDLLAKIYPDKDIEDDYLHHFLRGLNPEILEKGIASMSNSVEEAVKAARITESTLQYINISKALRDASQPTKKSYTIQ